MNLDISLGPLYPRPRDGGLRIRRFIAASCATAALLVAVPAQSAFPPSLLRCRASGTALFYFGGFEEYVWDDINVTGRCLGDSSGRQTATVTGYGSWGPPVFLQLSLRVVLTNASGTRVYNQNWFGLRLTCSIGRVVVSNPKLIPTGTGNVKQCPGPPGPDYVTVPISMTWNFLSNK